MSSVKWIRGTVIFMFLLLTACVDGDDGGGATDTTVPEITLAGENPLDLSVGDTYVDPGATASDNVDGNVTAHIVVAGDVVDTAAVGAYIVTYDVSDAAGNSATPLTRTINVRDQDAPEIILLGDDPLNLPVGDTYVDPGSFALDNVDGNITAHIVVAGDAVDTAAVGTYTVTYDVSDAAGNSATQLTRTVNVSDMDAPEIILLGDNPLNLSVGDAYVDPGFFALDNVDGNITAHIVVAGDAVDTAAVGTYVVTYDVSDAAGNFATQLTRTVNVSDPPPHPTSNVTNISLLVSSPQMPSDGSSTVTLTAVARDSDNNYVENAAIEFSASSGGILPGERTITNSSGRVSATLDVGGDPANRTITVTAVDSVTGQSASQLVEVRDTQFVFSGPQR
ncbi:MAG: DUF5011 domain-containing protein, partial [Gammaproteobacteria bacterium]|nr:DUF5011 domain-containing protein [Gammaproteobacteria bacterium]